MKRETITTADGIELTHGTFVKIWGLFPAVVACNRFGRIVGLIVEDPEYGRWGDYLQMMSARALAGGHDTTMAEWRRWSFSEKGDREAAARAVREKRLPLTSPGLDPRFWLELDPAPPAVLAGAWERRLEYALAERPAVRNWGNPAMANRVTADFRD